MQKLVALLKKYQNEFEFSDSEIAYYSKLNPKIAEQKYQVFYSLIKSYNNLFKF